MVEMVTDEIMHEVGPYPSVAIMKKKILIITKASYLTGKQVWAKSLGRFFFFLLAQ